MRTSVHLTRAEAHTLLSAADPDRVPARERDKLFLVVGRVWSGLNGLRNGADHSKRKARPKQQH